MKVRLLLQGRYEYFMQYYAARPIYGALLRAGVEIHEYSPSFLHAKVAVIDGRWATVGSSNLDPLSLLLAREANVVVEDAAFARRTARAAAARDAARRPAHGTRTSTSSRPWRQRVMEYVALALMRLALAGAGQEVPVSRWRRTWSSSGPRACTARRAISTSTRGGRCRAP